MSDARPSCGDFDPYNYTLAMKTLNLFTLPLAALGIYFTVCRSSRAMSTYRWFLLAHIVALTLCSLQFTVFLTPYFIFPVWGGMPLGLYNELSIPGQIQFASFMAIIGMAITSTVWLFYYRAQIVLPDSSILKQSDRGMRIFMGGLLVFNVVAALHICIWVVGEESEESMKEQYDQKLSCHMSILFDPRIQVLNPSAAFNLLLFFCLYFTYNFILILIFSTALGRLLHSRRSTLSATTRRLQLEFLRALIIQVTVTFLFLLIPNFVLVGMRGVQANRQFVNEVCMIVQSMNVIADVLCVLLLNKPYRNALFCNSGRLLGTTVKVFDSGVSVLY